MFDCDWSSDVCSSDLEAVMNIYVAPSLKGYIIDVVEATRAERDLILGVSPRGALALQRAARAFAASSGRRSEERRVGKASRYRRLRQCYTDDTQPPLI